MALSCPPDAATLAFADDYLENRKNPNGKNSGLTWEKILKEEPFEGQHWEGAYGLPPGSIKRSQDWDNDSDRSHGSTPSLSPWDDEDDLEGQDLSSSYSEEFSRDDVIRSPSLSISSNERKRTDAGLQRSRYDYRYEVEGLQAQQYWRPQWRNKVPTNLSFDIGNASTLGMATLIIQLRPLMASFRTCVS